MDVGNPSSSQSAAGGVVPNAESRNVMEANKVDSASTKQNEGVAKRKKTESRSRAWAHFEKIKDDKGIKQKAKCIYCSVKIGAHSKIHGTYAMRHHMLQCKKNAT